MKHINSHLDCLQYLNYIIILYIKFKVFGVYSNCPNEIKKNHAKEEEKKKSDKRKHENHMDFVCTMLWDKYVKLCIIRRQNSIWHLFNNIYIHTHTHPFQFVHHTSWYVGLNLKIDFSFWSISFVISEISVCECVCIFFFLCVGWKKTSNMT